MSDTLLVLAAIPHCTGHGATEVIVFSMLAAVFSIGVTWVIALVILHRSYDA